MPRSLLGSFPLRLRRSWRDFLDRLPKLNSMNPLNKDMSKLSETHRQVKNQLGALSVRSRNHQSLPSFNSCHSSNVRILIRSTCLTWWRWAPQVKIGMHSSILTNFCTLLARTLCFTTTSEVLILSMISFGRMLWMGETCTQDPPDQTTTKPSHRGLERSKSGQVSRSPNLSNSQLLIGRDQDNRDLMCANFWAWWLRTKYS